MLSMESYEIGRELCLVSDEGVVEDGFYSLESALAALNECDKDDELEIEYRDLYDESGEWIEDDEN